MSEKGWISIDRKIVDHWVWSSKPFGKGQAWIDLLIMANYKDQPFYSGGKIIDGKRGVVYRSLKSLAERWGWDRKTVRGFLKLLEGDGMVAIESTTQGTTITIVNYDNYQNHGTTNSTTERSTIPHPNGQRWDNPTDNDGTTMGQRFPTYNNYNNYNNDNKNIGIGYNYSSMAEAEGSDAPIPSDDLLNRIMTAWNEIPHVIPIKSIVPMTMRYDNLILALSMVGEEGVLEAIQSVKDSEWLAKRGHVYFDRWIVPDRIVSLIEGVYQQDYNKEEKTDGYDWDL